MFISVVVMQIFDTEVIKLIKNLFFFLYFIYFLLFTFGNNKTNDYIRTTLSYNTHRHKLH